MLIIGTITLVLLITLTRNKEIFTRILIGTLIYSTYLSYNTFIGTEISRSENIGIFGGLFHKNNLITTIEISIIILAILLITFLFSDEENGPEYTIILSFSILGMITLIESYDLISTFLAIELQSLSLYIITTIWKREATAAGLKYYLLGSLSSAILLAGLVLIYFITGITHYDGLASVISVTSENLNFKSILVTEISTISFLTILSTVLIMVGLLFKMGAAPFHHWAPDVYDSVPTIVTSWIAIMGKVSILTFILILQFIIDKDLITLNSYYLTIFAISAILCLIIGSVQGLISYRIKRLLTYSSISHLGFMLLAIINSNCFRVSAFLFYMFQYWLSTVTSFGILIFLSRFHYKNYDLESTASFKGLLKLNPVITLALIINFFSLTGIPPLIGFFGKQMIFYTSLLNGYYLITTIAILTSVITAAYYLRIIKTAAFPELQLFDSKNYLNTPESKSHSKISSVALSKYQSSEAQSETLNLRRGNLNLFKQTELMEIKNNKIEIKQDIYLKMKNYNSSLSILSWIISVISLITVLFFINPTIILNLTNLLALTFR